MASAAATSGRATGFLITIDQTERAQWRQAAAAAGISMAEYVRRAVRRADEAPTPDEIAAVRRMASEIDAAADRMAATLDRTVARIDRLLDPAHERRRRDEILGAIEREGLRLDLDALRLAP